MSTITCGKIQFHPSQRERYKKGELREEWASKYPRIFDEDDLRIARTQPNYHFFEWLGAIILYTSTGYLSLIEKYEFKNHRRKVALLQKILPFPVIQTLKDNNSQCPDLLVYSPDYSDWFFCEVKGPGDNVRKTQKETFEQLANVSNKPVRILEIRELRL